MRIGIDVIKINRFKRLIKNEVFLSKTFLSSELEYAKSKGEIKMQQTLAGIFATKEAFFKAMGVGVFNGGLTEVSVAHTATGAPILKLTKQISDKLNIVEGKINISITHDAGIAISVVVVD